MANSLIDNIKKDVKEYSKNVCKFASIEVREELAKTAYDTILQFYDDYEPVAYKRHYYNLEEKSFKKFYHNNHNTAFTGGIILSPEWMDDIYRADTELIFNLVYEGFHGLKSYVSPFRPAGSWGQIMNPSPMDIIEKKRDEIYKNPTSYINKAKIQAKQLSKYI